MEQSRKNLRASSIIILAFAVLTLLNTAFELFFGEINYAEIPADAPENIVLITKIVLAVVTLVVLLPQLYIGIKGLKMAKKPDSSKGHIVWGVILFVFTLIGLVSPAVAIVKLEDVFANASEFLSIAVDAFVLFYYVKYAKKVRKGK